MKSLKSRTKSLGILQKDNNMGYESKLYIGELHKIEDCYKEDKENPFEDGSGFPYLKDENGDLIPDGNKEQWLHLFGMIDLSKCGNCKLLEVVSEFRQELDDNLYPFIFGSDGNTQIKEDCYGDKLVPVPLTEVLVALKEDAKRDDYRRFKW